MNIRAFTLTIVIVATACSWTTEPTESTTSAFAGGWQDDDSTLATRAAGYLKTADGFSCSGVLVRIPTAPAIYERRLFLTAAHCITATRHQHPQMMAPGKDGGAKVGFGRVVDNTRLLDVDAVIDHPSFLGGHSRTKATDRGDDFYDVAMIILSKPVLDREPVLMPDDDKVACDLVGVGYGLRPDGSMGSKIAASLLTAGSVKGDLVDIPDGAMTFQWDMKPGDTLGGVACAGDSGGPLICPNDTGGKPAVYGVLRSSTGCTTPGRSRYTAIQPHKPWMVSVLQACSQEVRFFPETGIYACGPIADAYRRFNDIRGLGLPIASPAYERNDDGSGRAYLSQFTQRARIEHHPEVPRTPILFGRLGVLLLPGEGDRTKDPGPNRTGCQWITDADGAGNWVCDAYLTAWKENGALGQLGVPLTDIIRYYDAARGETWAQWFERGRLEMHQGGVIAGLVGCPASGLDKPRTIPFVDGQVIVNGCSP